VWTFSGSWRNRGIAEFRHIPRNSVNADLGARCGGRARRRTEPLVFPSGIVKTLSLQAMQDWRNMVACAADRRES